ncbi:Threonine/homoserine efflux transporter RhtA [Salegentibacter echinorum]|uniref:Threonine/homoserine efflux transporter RhtA n=1 Tax=Salegentibacter echinorum TaxID=1073325 RepID=A0A1M5IEG5_SALEC|nr:EamA family transporter [Salegentibacter echinorum]SHG26708.1 Threonine/homoserine efflux transporter RhtA [Salegentibacter echinorum]
MNTNFKSALYIAIGASSYGVLATFVKYANNNGFGTAGLAFSQYLFGAILLSMLSLYFTKKKTTSLESRSKYPKLKLMLFGTSLGLTSSFYYLSIQYVPVSVGIILLMQTIWMGVVLEFITARELVTKTKVLGAIIAIMGTALAAKIFEADIDINFTGIGFGLLAALSYTGGMYASNRVSLELPLITRSKYLVFGGLIIVILFWNVQILDEFNWLVFLKWGTFLGFFGTILPPVLFNKGFPEIGTGLGSIIAALEIPVSVFSAYLILQEEISALQWLGIVIILCSVVLINLKKVKRSR